MRSIAIALLFLLAACTPAQQETVKIGAALPLTGTASIYGQNARQGIDLAVQEINAAGGINGKPIEVIYEDDATDAAKSLTAVKKLIELDDVPVIIGGVWDFLANAVIPEIDQQKTVLVSTSALPDTVTASSPYFFVAHSPVEINQPVFEDWLNQQPGKRVGAIIVNNPWGVAHLATFKKAVDAVGGTLVVERILPNFDNNDISTELSIIKSKNIDGLFATLNFNDMILLGRKRMELGFLVPVLAHENFAGSIRAGKMPAARGEGVTIFRFSEPSPSFVEAFTNKYNTPPEFVADIAYDIVYALKAAIEKTGYDSESIKQGLHEVDFIGASGRVYFGENQYPANKQPLLEVLQTD